MGLKYKLGETEELKQSTVTAGKKSANGSGATTQRGQLNVQDHFLNTLRKEGKRVNITLLDGSCIAGKISGFDTFSIIIEDGGNNKLVYKHAISTIMKINE
jgi:host factor-I protein